jgi:cytidylate kinase
VVASAAVSTRVICVSRAAGAGGEDIGRLLAERLGYRYVDEEIVSLAAERGGFDREAVADTEERKTLVWRVLAQLASSTPEADLGGVRMEPERHRELIRDVIREVAEEGEAVIVAHAASHALAGRDGVLRVLVTASPEARSRRLAVSRGIDETEAAKALRSEDAARADYLKRFYGVERELPEQYDLVLNTETLPPQRAAAVIASAVAHD